MELAKPFTSRRWAGFPLKPQRTIKPHRLRLGMLFGKMNPDKDYRDFALKGAPIEWREYAKELFEAAHTLASAGKDIRVVSSGPGQAISKKQGYSSSTILLYAFSIENLLKSLLIAEHPSYISNGSLSKKVSGGSHPLVAINRKLSKSPVRKRDIRMLEILESAIPSWGRYPIPKSFENLTFEQIITDEFVAHVEDIYRRLDRFLYRKIKRGWSGPHGCKLKSCYWSEYEKAPPSRAKAK